MVRDTQRTKWVTKPKIYGRTTLFTKLMLFLNINRTQREEKLKHSWTVYLCDSPFYIKLACSLVH